MTTSFHITDAAAFISALGAPGLASLFVRQPANRWAVAKTVRAVYGEAAYATVAARIEMHHEMREAA